MAYSNIDQAVVLSSNQLPLGQVMQQGIAQAERQQSRQDQLEERRYETDQRNEAARLAKTNSNALHNLGTINKYVGEFKPIQADVDELVGNEMKEYKAFLMQNIGKDPIELDRLMSEKTPTIANSYAKMKNDLSLIKEQEDAFLKAMPNADPTAVREVIRNQFKQKYTGVDKDGRTILKDPMNSESNYIKIFDDPAKLAWVVGDNQQPLKDFFDKLTYESEGGSDYKNNQGNVIGRRWQGYKSRYSVVGADEKNNPKIDIEYKEVPTANGTIKIAGDTLREDMQSNPAVEKTFDIAWLNRKNQKGLNNIDPATDKIMKEAFRLEYATPRIKHSVKLADVEKTPVINISSGNGNGSGSKSDVEIKDIYKELSNAIGNKKAIAISNLNETQQKAVLNTARSLSGGIEEPVLDAAGEQILDVNTGKPMTKRRQLDQRDITIGKDDNGNINVYHVGKDKKGDAIMGEKIATISSYGANSTVNKGVKAQQAVIKKEKGKTQPQAASSAYSNITETSKGTIGVKDGKWYDIKTGKPIQ